MSEVTAESCEPIEELEREQLLAAVSDREELLEGILGGLGCFVTLDGDWCVTYANRSAADLAGMDLADLAGVDVRELLPHAVDEGSRDVLDRAMKARVPGEFDLSGPDGRVYRGTAYPLRGSGLAVYLRDVSEHVRGEQALREHRQLLQTVLDHSRDGISMLDLETGRFVFMNEAQAALTGFTMEEAEGMVAEEVFARVHPDDRDVAREQQRRIEAGEDQSEPVEYRWKVKSGEYRWFSHRLTIVHDPDGRPVALVSINADITGRKQAEATRHTQNLVLGGFATILEAALTASSEERLGEICLQVSELLTESPFGFIGEIDADGRLHDIALSDPGWRQCSLRDKKGHTRLPASLELHGLYGHVLVTGEPVLANEPASHPESIGVPDGHPAIVSFLGVPLKDDGRVAGLLAVANRPGGYRDEHLRSLLAIAPVIREAFQRRRIEEALHENELLSAAQQERNRLARDLHDSVTQALFAATIKAEALTLTDGLSASTSVTAEEVRRLTRGALAQMRTLLLELRADPLEEIPLQQLLRHLVEASESRASTSVRLTIRGDAELPPPVHVMLYRVVQEALNNVARHAKARSAWVVLDLDGAAHLVVGDDGEGFDPDLVPAGRLGLDSMRERAAEVGAELRIHSRPGRGTEIVVDWRDEAPTSFDR